MKVGYYVPAYGRSIDPTVWMQGCLEGMAAASIGYRLVPLWEDCNGIDLARNRVLEECREQGVDYVFMQDSDTAADGKAVIPRVLEIAQAHSAAVVAVGYPLRRSTPTLSLVPVKEGEVYECDMAGTGLMLIDVAAVNRVAEKYEGKWFERSHRDQRGAYLDEGGDAHFCRIMREHGESVYADAALPTLHVHKQPIEFYPNVPGSTGRSDRRTTGRDGG